MTQLDITPIIVRSGVPLASPLRTRTHYLHLSHEEAFAHAEPPVHDARVLLGRVKKEKRRRPHRALDTEVIDLTIEDRERILWALDDVRTDPPAIFAACCSRNTSGA